MRVIIKNGENEVIMDERRCIFVNVSKKVIRVFLDEIIYAESSVRKLRLICKNQVIEYYGKISDLEHQLEGDSFARCHKSYIVNLEYLRSYDAKAIELLDGTSIPISKQRYHDTKNKIIDFYGKPL
ncbi:MAG: LytTR family transcriptional regulator DNA-binding domain-containing protein [Lachnospiraceae bacterium]|nr:LytTR family transcriptional regulator DNA-binding domain-containing protein [Lachnospiraceae bacterium]